MRILAIETSTAFGSVALLQDGTSLAFRQWHRDASHSEVITQEISDGLQEAKLTVKQIDRIAVDVGPGSFTGLRVAVSAARAFAYALGKPVVIFNSCEILAHAALDVANKSALPLLVLLNAHGNRLYVAFCPAATQSPTNLFQIETLSLAELAARIHEPHLCIGDGYSLVEQALLRGELAQHLDLKSKLVRDLALGDSPRADVLGKMAWTFRESIPTLDWKALQPLYIRASGAEEKSREGHLK